MVKFAQDQSTDKTFSYLLAENSPNALQLTNIVKAHVRNFTDVRLHGQLAIQWYDKIIFTGNRCNNDIINVQCETMTLSMCSESIFFRLALVPNMITLVCDGFS